MPVYQTPGVYYERVDASSPGIFAIRTDVAGFVGIASRGPLHQAVPVQSWRQFQAYFGGFTGAGYLAYAVWAFFQNGGVRCWVVRVSSDLAATAEYTLSSAPPLGGPAWRLSAFSPGVWGNDLDVQVKETHRGETLTAGAGTPEYSAVASLAGFGRGTLVRLTQQSVTALKIVSEVDAGEGNPAGEKRIYWVNRKPETRRHFWADFGSGVQSYYDDTPLSGFDPALPILLQSVEYTLLVRELGRLVRVYQDVSTVPDHERYGPRLLPPLAPVKETDLGKFALAPEPVVIEELRDPQGGLAEWLGTLAVDPELAIQLVGGADGLAFLGVNDFIGEELSPLDSDLVRQRKQRGLRALEQVSEVAILAVPDIQIRPYQPPGKAPLPPCIPEPCLPAGPPQPAPPRTPAVGDLPPLFSEQEIFQVQAACVQQCEERRDRLALLDPPFAAARDDAQGVGALLGWRRT